MLNEKKRLLSGVVPISNTAMTDVINDLYSSNVPKKDLDNELELALLTYGVNSYNVSNALDYIKLINKKDDEVSKILRHLFFYFSVIYPLKTTQFFCYFSFVFQSCVFSIVQYCNGACAIVFASGILGIHGSLGALGTLGASG